MMYLCNRYCTEETQHLYPDDPIERGKVDRLLFFDMGTLHYAIMEYFGPKLHQGLEPDATKENLLKQSLDYLDLFLESSEGPYVCGGGLTIADFSLLASITVLDAMDYPYKGYGDLSKWVTRLKAELPYYKKCCEEGITLTKARVKTMEDDIKKEVEKERKKSLIKKKM